MQAAVLAAYGPPSESVRIVEVDQPSPGDGKVLIRVRAAAANPLDTFVRGTPYLFRLMFGLRRPKEPRLGRDVAGEVEAVGAGVTEFKRGDAVFGVCMGAFAEHACASAAKLILKPERLTFAQTAAVPIAGLTALQGLRDKGKLQAGQRVLINGAAGGVGTFAVQIAKSFGAEVTGVCSTRNVEMVRSLGADRVIDYTRQDFTEDSARYHVILDCVGTRSLFTLRGLLQPAGTYVLIGVPHEGRWIGPAGRLLRIFLFSRLVSRRFVFFLARITREDLAMMRDLLLSGKVTPVVDRTYPLSDVGAAIAYVEDGHARGKVVIMVA